jgi:hypothetical protein
MMPARRRCSSDRLAATVQCCDNPSNAVRVRQQAVAVFQPKVIVRFSDQRSAQLRRWVGECMLVISFGPLPSFNAAVGAMALKGG